FSWFRHDVGQGNVQCSCQLRDIEERNVPFSALDTADVSSMKAAQFRKPLLRDSFLLTKFAHFLAESVQQHGQSDSLRRRVRFVAKHRFSHTLYLQTLGFSASTAISAFGYLIR